MEIIVHTIHISNQLIKNSDTFAKQLGVLNPKPQKVGEVGNKQIPAPQKPKKKYTERDQDIRKKRILLLPATPETATSTSPRPPGPFM